MLYATTKRIGGERGQRDVAGQRRGHQKDGQQGERVNHARRWAYSRRRGCWWRCGRWRRWPGFRRRTGTRCWRCPARRVPRWDCGGRRSCVGHDGGEQRSRCAPSMATVNAGEKQRQNVFRVEVGDANGGRPRGDAAELAADGLDGQMEDHDRDRTHHDGHDGAGHAPREARHARIRMTKRAARPTWRASEIVSKLACARAASCAARIRSALAPMRRPKKSLICVLAMRTAMPLVNPMTTGGG